MRSFQFYNTFMESKELRLGNYILLAKDHTFVETNVPAGAICKVQLIKSATVGIDCVRTNCVCFAEIPISKVDPILLTEEWLYKCDFRKKESGNITTYYHPLIELDAHFFPKGVDHTIEIKYLHQLQNIYFALTGNELEIDF